MKKSIINLIVLLVLFITCTTCLFAWFVGGTSNQFEASIDGNDEDVSLIGIYSLNDSNYDGVADIIYDADSKAPIDDTTLNMSQYMELYYKELSSLENKNINNIGSRSLITYRIVLKNKSSEIKNINLFFPLMGGYDKNGKPLNGERLLYSIESYSYFTLKIENDDKKDIYTNELLGDITSPEITTISTKKNLWGLSNFEFVFDNNLECDTESYMFIDIQMRCNAYNDSETKKYYEQKMIEIANASEVLKEKYLTEDLKLKDEFYDYETDATKNDNNGDDEIYQLEYAYKNILRLERSTDSTLSFRISGMNIRVY